MQLIQLKFAINKIEKINRYATDTIEICQVYYENIKLASLIYFHIKDLKKSITQTSPVDKDFFLHAKKIQNSFEEFYLHLNQFEEDSSMMLNKIHRNLMKISDRKSIFYLIRFIISGLRNCVKKIVANIGVKNKKTLKELNCFMTIVVNYGVVKLIRDCLLHTHLTSLLASFVLESFCGYQKNIETVKRMVNSIYIENKQTNPEFFYALEEFFVPYLDHLLGNTKIFKRFLELDSIEIEATDEKEANNILQEIVDRALPKGLIMFNDYNLLEVQEHNYNAIPKSKEIVRRHLYDLLPKEIIVIPSRRDLKSINFIGKMLIDGKIALKEYLLIHPLKKKGLAKLLIVLTHELSHKIRFLCSLVRETSKKTLENFKSEADTFTNSLRFREFVKLSSINIDFIDYDLATKIIANEELSQELIEKLFPHNLETEFRGMERYSDLDDEMEIMCEGRIASLDIFNKKA
ncbi:hypothetical protein SteCoe_33489 [Stentor coeruleus]|uniref:Uncharacterized protein n=1 Tax=Stentor coeruleus TaxID=5963 RepID=A0A1R2AWN3_9CILI|nr:hypothetical protein SteCoe_33489 [Stentor coeruleus]